MSRLILASTSPRRKELLGLITKDFEIITKDTSEVINYQNDLVSEIEKLAFDKANAVFKEHNDKIVLGFDTLVIQNNQVLGKPKDFQDAFEMLSKLSNNKHQVITACAILSKEKNIIFHNICDVFFNNISQEEIINYLNTEKPYDKAGAYGIQTSACRFINKIEGDYYTVMGLPVSLVYAHLKDFDV